jgi:hypothetical protein
LEPGGGGECLVGVVHRRKLHVAGGQRCREFMVALRQHFIDRADVQLLRERDLPLQDLSVFSQEEQFFQKDIIELMEQLAMEASFALESLQREAERRYQATILADQNRILNLVASGADLTVIFTTLAQFVEAQSDGGFCSIVALDQKGSHYALGVAPSLPEGFDRAVVGASYEEGSGPCAEAMSNRSPVVVEDLAGYPRRSPQRVKMGLFLLRIDELFRDDHPAPAANDRNGGRGSR